jgi:hypothetical protein
MVFTHNPYNSPNLPVGLFAPGVKLPQFAVLYSIASYKLPLAGETFIRLDTIDLAIFPVFRTGSPIFFLYPFFDYLMFPCKVQDFLFYLIGGWYVDFNFVQALCYF